ncbi:hypothetical protein ACJJTC_005203 [Scirpophaga incertulas]
MLNDHNYAIPISIFSAGGEEQANVAAFLAIPLLLKQMHTIPVKGVRKPWNPSRSEVSNAFLSLVPSTSDLDKHYCDWEAKLKEKKIPLLTHIVAVGACWESIEQYDQIISMEVRYTFQNVCDAVTNTFKILWALDLPYSKDCVPIWMFIQRSIYMVKSKYDTEGTPMLDLLISVSNRHDGAVCNISYQLYNSFRRHYLKQHSDSLEPGLQASNPIEPQSYSSSEVLSTIEFQSCFSNDPSSHMPSTSLTQNKSSTTHYKDMNFITVPLRNTLGPLFSSLYGNPHLPNNVIDTVYHGVENMFNLSIKPFLLKLPGFAMEEMVTDLYRGILFNA